MLPWFTRMASRPACPAKEEEEEEEEEEDMAVLPVVCVDGLVVWVAWCGWRGHEDDDSPTRVRHRKKHPTQGTFFTILLNPIVSPPIPGTHFLSKGTSKSHFSTKKYVDVHKTRGYSSPCVPPEWPIQGMFSRTTHPPPLSTPVA